MNDNKLSLHEKIGITSEIQFGENIGWGGKEFKVTVIDPIDEISVGKIRYMGGLWNARIFPLLDHGKIESIFPGDEVSVVAREGNVCLVLPIHLAHSDLFNKSRERIEGNLKKKQAKNYKAPEHKNPPSGVWNFLSHAFKPFS